MNKELLWVGVRFDPDHSAPSDAESANEHHDAITKYISGLEERDAEMYRRTLKNGASVRHLESPIGELVDVCRAPDGCRIGFGKLVDSIPEGVDALPIVAQWLEKLGVTDRLVSVFTWSLPDCPLSVRPV